MEKNFITSGPGFPSSMKCMHAQFSEWNSSSCAVTIQNDYDFEIARPVTVA